MVLSANVLHNARHAGGMLAGLADLLAPGGLFVFVETTRELYSILTSMQFLMSAGPGEERLHPADPRAAGDRIFLTGEEWSRELENAGLRPWFTLPHDDHPWRRRACGSSSPASPGDDSYSEGKPRSDRKRSPSIHNAARTPSAAPSETRVAASGTAGSLAVSPAAATPGTVVSCSSSTRTVPSS